MTSGNAERGLKEEEYIFSGCERKSGGSSGHALTQSHNLCRRNHMDVVLVMTLRI